MVKEKDLNSIQKFGGIEGIAEALGSDLEKGIPGHEQDLLSHRIAHSLHNTNYCIGLLPASPKIVQ